MRISDFSGGLVTDPPASKLLPGEGQAVENLLVSARGSLRLRGGVRSLIPTDPTNPVLAFRRYSNGTISRLVYVRGYNIIARDEATNAETIIMNFFGFAAPTSIIQMYDRLIIQSPDYLYEWRGTGTVQRLGLAAPEGYANVNAINIGTGKLSSTTGSAIRYYVTFATDDGIESNPSPPSTPAIENTTNFTAHVYALPTSLDSRVTKRHLYREGGYLTRPTRIATINDNTTLEYDDNLADADVGTIQASFAHDAPPTGTTLSVVMKNRLLLARGYGLFVSSLGAPDYFPATVEDTYTDGIQFDIDPDVTNPITALGASGSAALIFRRKNLYILQGSDADTFSVNRVADIGCIAARSLVQCANIAVWLAPDGMVYALADDGPRPLGLDIERTLNAIPKAALPNACACFHRRRYHLCVPGGGSGGTALYLAYDFVTESWMQFTGSGSSVTQLYAESGIGDSTEILAATGAGSILPDGSGYQGIIAMLADGQVSDLPFRWLSGVWEPDSLRVQKKLQSVQIRGRLTPKAGVTCTAKFVCAQEKPDGSIVTDSRTYNLATQSVRGSILLDTSLDSALVGQAVTVEISGTGSVFELDAIDLNYTSVRQGHV